MAINYGTLRQSEKELIQKFYDYLEHANQMHLSILKALHSEPGSPEWTETIGRVQDMEKESNITHADLLDECTWIISKEQPQASHLRFVIAIINSINDLERICDYANNLSKFMAQNPQIYKPALDVVEDMENFAIVSYQKIFDFFKTNDAQASHQFALKLQDESNSKFFQALKALRQIYSRISFEANDRSRENKELIHVVLALKNVERILDHAINVIEHFVFIKESNFFFSKHG